MTAGERRVERIAREVQEGRTLATNEVLDHIGEQESALGSHEEEDRPAPLAEDQQRDDDDRDREEVAVAVGKP